MILDLTPDEGRLLLRLLDEPCDADDGPTVKAVAEKLRDALRPPLPRIPPAPPEYRELLKSASWEPRDGWGFAVSPLHPVRVLHAAGAPREVCDAVKRAMDSGCTVRFTSYQCAVANWESVAVFAPVPKAVRARLDAIDASGLRDTSLAFLDRKTRWYKIGRRARWEWIVDGG